MKINKEKNYKKPQYAIGIAAALTAAAVSGCGVVEYSGDVAVDPDTIDYAGGMTVNTPPEDEIELAGDVAVGPAEYTGGDEVILEGDVAIDPDEYTGGDELILEGDVEFCEPDSETQNKH